MKRSSGSVVCSVAYPLGLATSPSPEGPWTDRGEVVKTGPSDGLAMNAIDPDIVIDNSGQHRLAYGSFFAGIYIVKVDAKTGKLSGSSRGKLIACRNHEKRAGAIEGPYIVLSGAGGAPQPHRSVQDVTDKRLPAGREPVAAK